MSSRIFRRGSLLGMFLAFFIPYSIYAHARLIKSNPANAAELSTAPQKAEIWFNELLEDSFNTVDVFEARESKAREQKNFVKGKPRVDEKDRTHLVVELEKLGAGEYVMEYRVLSR